MLVLSRKKNEKIIMTLPDGRVIETIVADIRGDKVRLGIAAPTDVTIDREEVHKAKQKESPACPAQ